MEMSNSRAPTIPEQNQFSVKGFLSVALKKLEGPKEV